MDKEDESVAFRVHRSCGYRAPYFPILVIRSNRIRALSLLAMGVCNFQRNWTHLLLITSSPKLFSFASAISISPVYGDVRPLHVVRTICTRTWLKYHGIFPLQKIFIFHYIIIILFHCIGLALIEMHHYWKAKYIFREEFGALRFGSALWTPWIEGLKGASSATYTCSYMYCSTV